MLKLSSLACDDGKEIYHEVCCHSEFVFCLINFLISVSGCSSLLVAVTSQNKTILRDNDIDSVEEQRLIKQK